MAPLNVAQLAGTGNGTRDSARRAVIKAEVDRIGHFLTRELEAVGLVERTALLDAIVEVLQQHRERRLASQQQSTGAGV